MTTVTAAGLEVVDVSCRGNLARLWLGTSAADAWGDDWNDAPWEHNAGDVYAEHVDAAVDVCAPFELDLWMPGDDELNSRWSKADMRDGTVAALRVVDASGSGDDATIADVRLGDPSGDATARLAAAGCVVVWSGRP